MKTFLQNGETIGVTAPYALTSGAGCQVGSMFGVAVADAANGAAVQIKPQGCFTLDKTTGEAWTQGVILYWNNTTKKATTTVGTNKQIGYAVAAAIAGATTGPVWVPGL